ncbi:translation initiation factor IF-2-like isoform X2 [Acinonyx jubatus]|uniref:Translation initiation factor IF-2-like isoform X2 n=1 Tax=Acinonyx jubatus TaxID=32536 RepID=A0ABM3PC38_ACIJB|nr:translation initiation factor IF-2-like isoform X2 [Acinonyx jubatus]
MIWGWMASAWSVSGYSWFRARKGTAKINLFPQVSVCTRQGLCAFLHPGGQGQKWGCTAGLRDLALGTLVQLHQTPEAVPACSVPTVSRRSQKEPPEYRQGGSRVTQKRSCPRKGLGSASFLARLLLDGPWGPCQLPRLLPSSTRCEGAPGPPGGAAAARVSGPAPPPTPATPPGPAPAPAPAPPSPRPQARTLPVGRSGTCRNGSRRGGWTPGGPGPGTGRARGARFCSDSRPQDDFRQATGDAPSEQSAGCLRCHRQRAARPHTVWVQNLRTN